MKGQNGTDIKYLNVKEVFLLDVVVFNVSTFPGLVYTIQRKRQKRPGRQNVWRFLDSVQLKALSSTQSNGNDTNVLNGTAFNVEMWRTTLPFSLSDKHVRRLNKTTEAPSLLSPTRLWLLRKFSRSFEWDGGGGVNFPFKKKKENSP